MRLFANHQKAGKIVHDHPIEYECFDLLLKHVPMESPAYGCLEKAVRIYATSNTVDAYWLDCMPEQLDEFLDAARKHFPNRVTEIEEAIAKAIVKAV